MYQDKNQRDLTTQGHKLQVSRSFVTSTEKFVKGNLSGNYFKFPVDYDVTTDATNREYFNANKSDNFNPW